MLPGKVKSQVFFPLQAGGLSGEAGQGIHPSQGTYSETVPLISHQVIVSQPPLHGNGRGPRFFPGSSELALLAGRFRGPVLDL